MAENLGIDAYSPKEIAERVENIGVTKARLPLLSMMALGVLAGHSVTDKVLAVIFPFQ